MPTLSIEKKTLGDFRVLVLKGELIVSTLAALKKSVQEEFAVNKFFMALDMIGVSQIDSSALGLINNIKKKTDEKEGHFVLFSVPPHALQSLTDTGILGNIVIVKNEEEFKDNFIL
jgi:anti-anti-sigma factor